MKTQSRKTDRAQAVFTERAQGTDSEISEERDVAVRILQSLRVDKHDLIGLAAPDAEKEKERVPERRPLRRRPRCRQAQKCRPAQRLTPLKQLK